MFFLFLLYKNIYMIKQTQNPLHFCFQSFYTKTIFYLVKTNKKIETIYYYFKARSLTSSAICAYTLYLKITTLFFYFVKENKKAPPVILLQSVNETFNKLTTKTKS